MMPTALPKLHGQTASNAAHKERIKCIFRNSGRRSSRVGTAIADTIPLRGDLHILEMIHFSKVHSLLSLTCTGLLEIAISWT